MQEGLYKIQLLDDPFEKLLDALMIYVFSAFKFSFETFSQVFYPVRINIKKTEFEDFPEILQILNENFHPQDTPTWTFVHKSQFQIRFSLFTSPLPRKSENNAIGHE